MSAIKQALKKAKEFHGKEARKVSTVSIPDFTALICLGDAQEIVYASDKHVAELGKDKKRVYRHKIGQGVKVYTDPKGKCVLIFGGKFHVTDWLRG